MHRLPLEVSHPTAIKVIEEPFQLWGLDVIGEFFPHSSKKHCYILIVMDYFP